MNEVKIKKKIKIKQLGCASPNTRAGVQPTSSESKPNGPLVRLGRSPIIWAQVNANPKSKALKKFSSIN